MKRCLSVLFVLIFLGISIRAEVNDNSPITVAELKREFKKYREEAKSVKKELSGLSLKKEQILINEFKKVALESLEKATALINIGELLITGNLGGIGTYGFEIRKKHSQQCLFNVINIYTLVTAVTAGQKMAKENKDVKITSDRLSNLDKEIEDKKYDTNNLLFILKLKENFKKQRKEIEEKKERVLNSLFMLEVAFSSEELDNFKDSVFELLDKAAILIDISELLIKDIPNNISDCELDMRVIFSGEYFAAATQVSMTATKLELGVYQEGEKKIRGKTEDIYKREFIR